jgi:transglutaminase-like putative cysteine protease
MIFRTRSIPPVVASLAFALAAVAADLAATKPAIAPAPAWAPSSLALDLAAESRAKASEPTSSGMEFLHYDEQYDVASHLRTTHTVFRIATQGGLAGGSQIIRDFDPTYEALEWHFVRVWRDGAAQDRLTGAEIKVLQQERDLDRQMFNGRLSAMLVLSDVRVGDIVEYSHTVRGANPVFDGKFIDHSNTSWASPVRFQRMRIILPPGRMLHSRAHGDAKVEQRVAIRDDGSSEQIWTLRDPPVFTSDTDVPSWHVAHSYLEFSEYASWEDVRAWALPLYEFPAGDPALRAKALELTARARAPEEKILAILDFVQRDVRYLGFELGANTHRPHPPTQVFHQRFGDCKDKVVLFCALLAEVGLAAHPALVNTYHERTLHERLPSPYAFNHVIARVVVGDERYWLDPTQSYQRGDLKARDAVYESKALVVNADSPPGLERVHARPEAAARREVSESYSYTDYSQPGKLRLTYRYFGAAANGARAFIEGTSKEDVTRDLLDRHKRNHPELVASAPLRTRDDPQRNFVEIELDCLVPELWTRTATSSAQYQATFYPWTLHNYSVRPENVTRRAPLALEHPATQKVRIEIDLTGSWVLPDSDKEVATDWYRFTARSRFASQKLTVDYAWESRADHVPVDQLRTHLAKLAEIRDLTGLTLTQGAGSPSSDSAGGVNWRTTLLGLLVVAGFVLLGWWLNSRPAEPPPLIASRQFVGIAGWLLLPAFSLCVRPFIILKVLIEGRSAYFDETVWASYMTPELSSYQPALGVLLAFEVTGNLTVLMLSLLTAWFFFRRRRQAPLLFIALLGVTPVVGFVSFAFGQYVELPDRSGFDEALKSAIQGVVAALIWIPYFKTSRRVKATFTR